MGEGLEEWYRLVKGKGRSESGDKEELKFGWAKVVLEPFKAGDFSLKEQLASGVENMKESQLGGRGAKKRATGMCSLHRVFATLMWTCRR